MDPIKIYYFVSRFLDSDIPSVTNTFKESIVKDTGVIEMLIMFITQSFPESIRDEIKSHQIKQQQEINESSSSLSASSSSSDIKQDNENYNNIDKESLIDEESIEVKTNNNNKPIASIELMKSYKVMNLFLHSSPLFISIVKDRLPIIVKSLFEIFSNENLNSSSLVVPNIYHFCKVFSSLFYQYTNEFLNELSEIQVSSQKMYFQVLFENIHFTPVQELFLIIAKRASASVNEYQTTNPIETKKILKALQKSKIFTLISQFFISVGNSTTFLNGEYSMVGLKNEKIALMLEGTMEFINKCIEQCDIHGPDVGFTITSFQNKEFVESLLKILLNETKKKDNFIHRKYCLQVLLTFCKQSNEYSSRNSFQQEKDSIFSASGSPVSWLFYLSTNHLPSICKILVDCGNDPNQKQHLGSYRIDLLSILIDLIKSKSTFKRKQPNQLYLSVELWYFLVDWFFQFSNIYHSKFFSLVRELFIQQHLPSIKHFCNFHLTRFISFYLASTSTSASEVNGKEKVVQLPLKSSSFSPDLSSTSRGVVLLMLNFIRISSSQFPASHYLPTFLKSNDQWNSLQKTLIKDTISQYTNVLENNDESLINDNLHLINFGSEFAESIGFSEDNENTNNKSRKLLVDEFQTGGGSSTNGNSEPVVPQISEAELARIEKELLKDDENKKKKKGNNSNNNNNKNKKKK